jgi:hypothetical protein
MLVSSATGCNFSAALPVAAEIIFPNRCILADSTDSLSSAARLWHIGYNRDPMFIWASQILYAPKNFTALQRIISGQSGRAACAF